MPIRKRSIKSDKSLVPSRAKMNTVAKLPEDTSLISIPRESNQCYSVVQKEDFLPIDSNNPCNYCPRCNRPFWGKVNEWLPASYRRKYFKYLSDKYMSCQSILGGSYGSSIPSGCINTGYYNKFFQEIKLLGRGAGGAVFHCQHILDEIPLGQYAVKKIPVGEYHSWLIKVLQEVKMLEEIQHPNIISYKHSWIEKTVRYSIEEEIESSTLFLLTEYANGGNLEDYVNYYGERKKTLVKYGFRQPVDLIKNYPAIPVEEIEHLFICICNALNYLHSNEIIHRDLKPLNMLLVSSEESPYPVLKICDLGKSLNERKKVEINSTHASGTLEYMAPELLDDTRKYDGKKCDIWSLGIILFFLCYGRTPYSSEKNKDLEAEIKNFKSIEFPKDKAEEKVPDYIKDLIKWLLFRNPQDRPCIREVMDFLFRRQQPTQMAADSREPPLWHLSLFSIPFLLVLLLNPKSKELVCDLGLLLLYFLLQQSTRNIIVKSLALIILVAAVGLIHLLVEK